MEPPCNFFTTYDSLNVFFLANFKYNKLIFFFLLDLENKSYILKNGGVGILYECLLLENEATVISAITALMFLVTPESISGNIVACGMCVFFLAFNSMFSLLYES